MNNSTAIGDFLRSPAFELIVEKREYDKLLIAMYKNHCGVKVMDMMTVGTGPDAGKINRVYIDMNYKHPWER